MYTHVKLDNFRFLPLLLPGMEMLTSDLRAIVTLFSISFYSLMFPQQTRTNHAVISTGLRINA